MCMLSPFAKLICWKRIWLNSAAKQWNVQFGINLKNSFLTSTNHHVSLWIGKLLSKAEIIKVHPGWDWGQKEWLLLILFIIPRRAESIKKHFLFFKIFMNPRNTALWQKQLAVRFHIYGRPNSWCHLIPPKVQACPSKKFIYSVFFPVFRFWFNF